MKRTITPEERKRFPQENITLNILEDEVTGLQVEIELRKVREICSQLNAKIFLEAHTKTEMDRIDLGTVEDYQEERQSRPLPSFASSQRPKIKFRLKITDPITYKLQGYAENLKESRSRDSLIQIYWNDESMTHMIRLDFEDEEHPVAYVCPKLEFYRDKLKPILAEMIFRQILMYLIGENDIEKENLEEHKWWKFANKLVQCEDVDDYFKKLSWIDEVLGKFSQHNKLIDQTIKTLQER